MKHDGRPVKRTFSAESQLILPEDRSKTVPNATVGTHPVYPSCLYSQSLIEFVLREAAPELNALGYGPPANCPLPDD